MTSKRTILITGCSDGSLGSHLAVAFHKAGWRVFASARNLNKLKHAQTAGIETIQLDVTSDDSITKAFSQVSELTSGSLDVLLNNAGAGYSMPLIDLDLGEARKLFDLNVWSIISMTRAFLPLLTKSQHGGIVVNNTSCSSLTAGMLPFAGAYAASKAAAAGLTEILRLELAPFNIKVINLMTGAVRSTFFDNTPDATLPPTSVYNFAKETVEKTMSGGDNMANASDPEKWAESVVQGLSKPTPPHWLWRGKFSTLVRIGSLLPIGFLDGTVKKMTGLDVLERKVKEQGGASAVLKKMLS
jgi:NAD(P)-dependent dehydrogenase (short-subunit alcohol dehydrogenase family)